MIILGPSYNNLNIMLWSYYDQLTIILWLSLDHLIGIFRQSKVNLTVFFKLSYDHLKIILQSLYDHSIIIYNHCTLMFGSSCRLLNTYLFLNAWVFKYISIVIMYNFVAKYIKSYLSCLNKVWTHTHINEHTHTCVSVSVHVCLRQMKAQMVN